MPEQYIVIGAGIIFISAIGIIIGQIIRDAIQEYKNTRHIMRKTYITAYKLQKIVAVRNAMTG